jgi:hypothetical protein
VHACIVNASRLPSPRLALGAAGRAKALATGALIGLGAACLIAMAQGDATAAALGSEEAGADDW